MCRNALQDDTLAIQISLSLATITGNKMGYDKEKDDRNSRANKLENHIFGGISRIQHPQAHFVEEKKKRHAKQSK